MTDLKIRPRPFLVVEVLRCGEAHAGVACTLPRGHEGPFHESRVAGVAWSVAAPSAPSVEPHADVLPFRPRVR